MIKIRGLIIPDEDKKYVSELSKVNPFTYKNIHFRDRIPLSKRLVALICRIIRISLRRYYQGSSEVPRCVVIDDTDVVVKRLDLMNDSLIAQSGQRLVYPIRSFQFVKPIENGNIVVNKGTQPSTPFLSICQYGSVGKNGMRNEVPLLRRDELESM